MRVTIAPTVAWLLISLAGCAIMPSHIHDADRASRTSKLVALVDEYGEKSPTVYDALLTSSRAIATQQDLVLKGLSESRSEAIVQQLPTLTGERLLAERSRITRTVHETRTALQRAVTAYLAEKGGAEQKAKHAADAIKSAEKQLKAAREQVSDWNATIAVLEAGIGELPAAAGNADTKSSGVEALGKRLAEVGDKEVEYVDADGTTQKRKIKDVLRDRIEPEHGKFTLDIPDAPGATLTIMTLGVDLARVEKQAAEARLAQLARRLQLYERVAAELDLAEVLLSDLKEDEAFRPTDVGFVVNIARQASKVHAADQAALDAAGRREGENADDENNRINAAVFAVNKSALAAFTQLVDLRKLAIAESIATRTQMDLERTTARLRHEESILDSKVNDVAWRSAIRSGVLVLDQYEQGGFTAEDAATIIHIAQTIALGVIAAGI